MPSLTRRKEGNSAWLVPGPVGPGVLLPEQLTFFQTRLTPQPVPNPPPPGPPPPGPNPLPPPAPSPAVGWMNGLRAYSAAAVAHAAVGEVALERPLVTQAVGDAQDAADVAAGRRAGVL